MKAVILAGGYGTRLAEETELRPKPLVQIGGKPILWHIMKLYESAGITEFVVCCGYKGHMIKSYFVNYFAENYDLEVDLGLNSTEILGHPNEQWKVTLIDTGQDTMTGGRLKRVAENLDDKPFCMTYGDGIADIDLPALIAHHRDGGTLATVTAVPSPGRFGVLDISAQDEVDRFYEKPNNEMGWINGGFFVLEPGAIAYIDDDQTSWESEPLERLAADGQLSAYRHTGFWKPMDSLRDKRELEDLWSSGEAPWKAW